MNIDFNLPEILFEQHFSTDFSEADVLTPGEQLLVKNFSEKRRKDFSTGRHCAHEVLKKMGAQTFEILTGPRKEPIWPEGFTGSISHSKELAGAVAALSSKLLTIGLDIEKNGRVKAEMWDLLFQPQEQEYLRTITPAEQLFYTTLFFSMKESFYKLQHPLTNSFLGFTDVEINEKGGRYRIRVTGELRDKKLLPEWTEMHYSRYGDHIITLGMIATD